MTRPIRVLELRSVWGTGGGPEKTILTGAAQADPTRFLVTVCYVRDARDKVFSIDAKAASWSVPYTELIERHSFDPTLWRRLRRMTREQAIDIVHSHDYKTDLLAWLLSKFERVAAISTAHGWTGHSARERWLYYPFGKRLLARFGRVIAVSRDITQELIRHGASADHVTTILNGIDHRQHKRERSREQVIRQRLGISREATVLGSVGRLEPQKRFDLLIESFHRLRSRFPDLVLVIVGDGSLKDSLASQISRLGLGDSCRLLGQRTDIVDLHHAFDVYVQSSDYEGTPNTVLEAMALETPVVATDVGGTAELIRNGMDGVLCRANDVDVLVGAVAGALADRAKASWMAASARRRVETTLSFDARMKAVEAIYSEIFCNRTKVRSTSSAISAGT
jgi:glycosyltransferase involved in cell wall biosynthesis